MKVEMINRMAHLTPVQTYRSAVASGVSVLEAADEVGYFCVIEGEGGVRVKGSGCFGGEQRE